MIGVDKKEERPVSNLKLLCKILHLKDMKITHFDFKHRDKELHLAVKPYKNGCRCPHCGRRGRIVWQAAAPRRWEDLHTITLQSEAAVKLRDRLQKNRDKLFTFLSFDGVPWNNNNAEHAVKAFATLRKVIGGSSTAKGIREYLILLSICETCKYKRLDFLDFLRSGEKNIDSFASKLRRR